MRSSEKLEHEVAAIGGLSRAQLVEAWIKAHGSPPPKGVKQHLLELSAAWRLQAKRLGGLSAATRKALSQPPHSAQNGTRRSSGSTPGSKIGRRCDPRPALASGTRLMREWNGRMHIVDVMDDGFMFDGKRFRSLSAIARRITGARWSGPRFFGL
ncbi:MAG: DUF2924 domain-containing protein [Aureliella sp.]